MSATLTDIDPNLSQTAQDAIEIIETATEHDQILFNDRVQPLTVRRVSGPFDGLNDTLTLTMCGPQGGDYRLRYSDRYGSPTVSLGRQIGYNDAGIPLYNDIDLDSIELVEHHQFGIGQVIEQTDPVSDAGYYVVTEPPEDIGAGTAVLLSVSDGEITRTDTQRLSHSYHKERLFDGELEHVDTIPIGYGNRGEHYDTERDECVQLSGPHERGVDLRPVDGNGLTVVDWETILFDFEDRFTPVDE